MITGVAALAAAAALASPALVAPFAAPLLQSATASAAAAAAAIWLRLQTQHQQSGAERIAPKEQWVSTALGAMRAARTTASEALDSAGMSIAAIHSAVTAAASAALISGLPLRGGAANSMNDISKLRSV